MNVRWQTPLVDIADAAAQWRDLGDTEIIEETGGKANAEVLGWCDLSPLPRTGAKGRMKKQVPPINGVKTAASGALHCRLSEDEFLFLSAADGAPLDLSMMSARLWLPRRDSHCWLGLCGARADEVLSVLCAVLPPAAGELLQTQAAAVAAIIIHASATSCPAYHILADSGYAHHLWDAVAAAAIPRGGNVIGWRQWRDIFADEK